MFASYIRLYIHMHNSKNETEIVSTLAVFINREKEKICQMTEIHF
jgi:hypothetical protein